MKQQAQEYVTWLAAVSKGLAYGLTHSQGVHYADSTVRLIYGPSPESPAQAVGTCHYCERNDAGGRTIANPYNGRVLPMCRSLAPSAWVCR